ncbi:MAG: hypothetical protein LBS22_04290 [Puniceicoccales bacterium]|jgi:hypothetical protein|nr:hypothetical protein [Puniceicoccales bacterium]
MPAMEKCGVIGEPAMAANSASAAHGSQIQTATEGSTEDATTKRSFWRSGFQTLGDVMADEDPVVLSDGIRDYADAFNAESRLQPGEKAMGEVVETVTHRM